MVILISGAVVDKICISVNLQKEVSIELSRAEDNGTQIISIGISAKIVYHNVKLPSILTVFSLPRRGGRKKRV